MRLLTVLSGTATIIAGIFCLLNREQSFASYAFVLCIALICSAFLGILSYFIAFRRRGLPLWSLIDGLLALALAYLILKGRIGAEEYLPQMIGLWVIFTGIIRLAGAIDIRRETLAFRVVISAMGIANVLLGVYCFYYPLYTKLMMAELIGNIFIFYGINIAAIGFGVKGKSAVNVAEAKPVSKDIKERREWFIKDEMKEVYQYSSAYKEIWIKLTELIPMIIRGLRGYFSRVAKRIGLRTEQLSDDKTRGLDIFEEKETARRRGTGTVRTRMTDNSKTEQTGLVNYHDSFANSKEKKRRTAITALKPVASDNTTGSVSQFREKVEIANIAEEKKADTGRASGSVNQLREKVERVDTVDGNKTDMGKTYGGVSQLKEKVEKADKTAIKETDTGRVFSGDGQKERIEKTDSAVGKKVDMSRKSGGVSQFKEGKIEKIDKSIAKKADSGKNLDNISRFNEKVLKTDKAVGGQGYKENDVREDSRSKSGRYSKKKRKKTGKTAVKQADHNDNSGKTGPLGGEEARTNKMAMTQTDSDNVFNGAGYVKEKKNSGQ